MSELAAEIVIESVEPKEGVSAQGKAWKLYRVKSTAGVSFSTFDGTLGSTAFGAVGKRARIKYTTNEKGNNLVSLVVDESSEVPVEPVRDLTPDGGTDWDMIGLRKTRCALWSAAIGAGLDAGQCRAIVLAAEVDIFHRQPADDTADLPFDADPSLAGIEF